MAVAAPPIATRIRASATTRIAIPRTAGSAWAPSARSRTAAAGCRPTPRIASNAEARRAARRAVSPPGSRPASARRAPTGPIAGTQTFTGMPSARSSAASSAIRGRSEPRVALQQDRAPRADPGARSIHESRADRRPRRRARPPSTGREQVAEQLRPLRPRRLAGRGQEADPPAGGRAKAGMLHGTGIRSSGPATMPAPPPAAAAPSSADRSAPPRIRLAQLALGSPRRPAPRPSPQRRSPHRSRRRRRGADSRPPSAALRPRVRMGRDAEVTGEPGQQGRRIELDLDGAAVDLDVDPPLAPSRAGRRGRRRRNRGRRPPRSPPPRRPRRPAIARSRRRAAAGRSAPPAAGRAGRRSAPAAPGRSAVAAGGPLIHRGSRRRGRAAPTR